MCGLGLLPVVGIVVTPHAMCVLLACFKDDVKVSTHMSYVVSMGGQYSHIGDKATGPLEEGVLDLVALTNET